MLKHILFVVPYPMGESPSQRFRFEQYLEILQAKGYHFRLCSFWSVAAWRILYKSGNQLTKILALLSGFLKRVFQLLFFVPTADFVFIHREATPIGPPWFEWVTAKVFRKKIVYDFDDAIWLTNTSRENNLVSKLKWHSKVSAVCKWSYAVSCGNQYLCNYAKQFNNRVFLNPTTIDAEKLHNPSLYPNKEQSKQFTVGWTGTHSTLKYIDFIVPAIQSLEKKFPGRLKFTVIADKKPTFELSSFHFVQWSKENEIEDLVQFDIGLMPLADDIWSKGKCGFKALQYMALGIPALASPVGVNSIIIDDGINGFLCNSVIQWEESIQKLIEDAELRKRMGTKGREKIVNYYSAESNSSNFLSLFE
ncbi:MAG: glycosyltransferase family 4 protein [Chryseolinea sp.]